MIREGAGVMKRALMPLREGVEKVVNLQYSPRSHSLCCNNTVSYCVILCARGEGGQDGPKTCVHTKSMPLNPFSQLVHFNAERVMHHGHATVHCVMD